MCTFAYATVHMWRWEDGLWELILCFHLVGSGDQTWVTNAFTYWAILLASVRVLKKMFLVCVWCFFRAAVTCTCVHMEARGECWVSCSVTLFQTGSVTELEPSWQAANPSDPAVCPNSTGWRDTHSHASLFLMGGQFKSDPWACRTNCLISSWSLRDPSCQLITFIFIGKILRFLSSFILFLKSLKFGWQILVLKFHLQEISSLLA